MSRISGQARLCLERAEEARQLANNYKYAPAIRHDYSEIAIKWLDLARTFQLAEEVSGYIEWNSQRVENPT